MDYSPRRHLSTVDVEMLEPRLPPSALCDFQVVGQTGTFNSNVGNQVISSLSDASSQTFAIQRFSRADLLIRSLQGPRDWPNTVSAGAMV
ncbi:hypothetical protein COMA1_11221 [Candidatus Nitrospira nitrosa]|uniref:Uncharacterized protein n=1 Tax=Candidatus Nitrospira nitrosa TaxID=1742972 RepID=A0A0S4L781_9BACT|nr:hypothetical protein COMA1_11221 [Candidatus Nitrospira nitrosa]